jgi:hypothetical protein
VSRKKCEKRRNMKMWERRLDLVWGISGQHLWKGNIWAVIQGWIGNRKVKVRDAAGNNSRQKENTC